MSTAIKIKDLTVIFKGKWGISKKAVDQLSFEVTKNSIFGFIGHNGAGKTTTIKILTGLCMPTKGSAEIMGVDISQMDARSHIGFLPENPYFYEYLTAEESLIFYAKLHQLPKNQIEERVTSLLEEVGLSEARKAHVRGFSKGMKQRLGLAQAMIHDPDIYILDEPLSGLDPVGRREVREKIIDLKKREKTIFFTSHVLSDVEMLCDEVALVAKGKLVSLGSLDQLLNREILSIDIHGEGFSTEAKKELEKICSHLLHKDNMTFATVDTEEKALNVKKILDDCGGKLKAFVPYRENLEDFYVKHSAGDSV